MRKTFFFFLVFLLSIQVLHSQIVTASFNAPDTVCPYSPVNIQNTSQSGSSYYWSFCAADFNTTPEAVNIGNPSGVLSSPVFGCYALDDNGNFYGLIMDYNSGELSRLNFGNSLLNIPTGENLGNLGGALPEQAEGIQLLRINGEWNAIMVGGGNGSANSSPRVVKIYFGNSLANTPVATNWGNIGGLNLPHDFYMSQESGIYYGFAINVNDNTITRINFGPDLNGTPTGLNLGNIGNIDYPAGFTFIKNNSNWFAYIANRVTNSITRLDFGTSLLNIPTGVNIGNPGGLLDYPRDISIFNTCNEVDGFVVNETSNEIVKLNFGTDPASTPQAIDLGNIGDLSFPHSISDFFRVGNDIYAFIPNVVSSSLTRIRFAGCQNLPGSILKNPPPVIYPQPGTYNINLLVDLGLPSQTSYCKKVVVSASTFDFSYSQDVCNPLLLGFTSIDTNAISPYWSFGDGSAVTGTLSPTHSYTTPGNYTVKFTVKNSGCIDTIIKTISVSSSPGDIIVTPDTTICAGSKKQLRTVTSLNFCWTPTSYLDNPLSPNPTTSSPNNITYYFTGQVTGANLISNGNFETGNKGFTSGYNYATPNLTEGEYFIGSSPQAWNSSLGNCADHTTGNGNMMLVNGDPQPDIKVWQQTITVTPNTNYALSTWIQALYPPNPAQMAFSINGSDIGNLITASLPTCTWTQFFTTWNSGNNTTATIAIINKNTFVEGNDFALDDISFAPVFIKKDSVKITVNNPSIKSSNDSVVCSGSVVQLQTSGATNYSWTPVTGLSNANTANPVVTINNNTSYIVTGTNNFGCIAKDTVSFTSLAKPFITKSNDTTICSSKTVQLFASGGTSYSWSPASSLSNANIYNPTAAPASNTEYFVTVTGSNLCSAKDSVLVKVNPIPVFTISPDASVCTLTSKQLFASGGDSYVWSPAVDLSNPLISNPVVTPSATTTYSVVIKANTCNETATLSTMVTALALPVVSASSSNDITCSVSSSQLQASGASAYAWSPAAGLTNINTANPVATPSSTTIYKVTGTDINGCVNSDTVTVKADYSINALYLLPNSFTPNGDGINDCFGVKYWGSVQQLEFSVYNRFGQKVFYTNDPSKCWDGNYHQQPQDADVFVYVITAKTACGLINRKGSVSLIR